MWVIEGRNLAGLRGRIIVFCVRSCCYSLAFKGINEAERDQFARLLLQFSITERERVEYN